ncbi:MAG: response regulator [Desulfobulbaceae bacterium]|nr:response regulator [Desulfobulbaceae bacterium]
MESLKNKHKVLIVDDEDIIRDTFSRLLGYAGYECDTASNGKEALALLEKDNFSLLLSDINMPIMNGIELLRHSLKKFNELAAIMISGVDDRDVAISCLELGAYGYIIKPVQMNELVINIANALHRRELEITNKKYNTQLEKLVAERTEELTLAKEETIMTLGKAAEFRDNETAQHTYRMSHFCWLLALKHGLPEEHCEQIRLASPLHDIGKIGISDTILLKPGRLTDEEFKIIQQHSEIGYRILADAKSDLLRLGATIAYTHHEKFDGNGYPRQLKGTEIPVEGRIAAISDVFDALTTNRVYKDAIPTDKALEIMKEGRGNHFDPDILDVFLANIDDVLLIKEKCADPEENPQKN